MNKEQWDAAFAKLLDHFHLRPWEIGRLTDRQILDYYFHPRTEEGEIQAREPPPKPEKEKEPEKQPATLRQELISIDVLLMNGLISPQNAMECKQRLKEQYARKAAEAVEKEAATAMADSSVSATGVITGKPLK